MTKFKVGDRVRNMSDTEVRDVPIGEVFTVVGVGDSGVWVSYYDLDGVLRKRLAKRYELFIDSETYTELTELRQFKADAIAKYPDLAPLSEEDKWLLEQYNAHYNRSATSLDGQSGVLLTYMRRAIQWGRNHAN